MKKLMKLLFASLLFPLSCAAYADADPYADMVKQTVAAYMQKNHVPGVAVELYVEGKPYSYYFGYANPDKKTPVTKKTIFEVGSISKIMTSILFAQEIDFAKMGLTDPVTKYVPDLPHSFAQTTVQSLATHTSGLPFSMPGGLKSEDDLNHYLANLKPSYAPNKQWVYSNFGVGMLGYTLEKVTHKDLNQLYQKRILLPLGMQPIGLIVPDKLKMYYAQGYDAAGRSVPPAVLGILPGAYGIKMSAEDMQRFLKAAIGLPGTPERLFYPIKMTQAGFVRLPDIMQGLAWQIHDFTPDEVPELLKETDNNFAPLRVEAVLKQSQYNGDALIDKTGGTDGFRTYIAVIPNKKSGIAILSNKFVANDITNLGRKILFKAIKMN